MEICDRKLFIEGRNSDDFFRINMVIIIQVHTVTYRKKMILFIIVSTTPL